MPVPVTILSGFLGAGKTTMLQNILLNTDGLKVGVIVNDIPSINIDHEMSISKQDGVVSLANGCVCCSLRGDLINEIKQMAAQNFDAIVVEATGIAEPKQIAAAFDDLLADPLHDPAATSAAPIVVDQSGVMDRTQSYRAATGSVAGESVAIPLDTRPARLDTLVTVIDSESFLHHFESTTRVGDNAELVRIENASSDDQRHIVDLLIDQVEVANVIVLNKTDLVEPTELLRLKAIIISLNPTAKLIQAQFSRVAITELLQTDRYRTGAAGKLAVNSDQYTSTISGQAGVTSFAWTTRRPFHPVRLHTMICNWKNESVLRAKGYVCVATAGAPSKLVGHNQLYFALAGRHLRLHIGRECAAHKSVLWPNNVVDPPACHYHDGCNDHIDGVNTSEIVFIGINQDEAAIGVELDGALCTDSELRAGLPLGCSAVKPLPAEPWKVAELEEAKIKAWWRTTAVVLAVFTIVWNVAEGIVSIYLGLEAESFAVVSFGGDSLIEVASACFVLWRLWLERTPDDGKAAHSHDGKAAHSHDSQNHEENHEDHKKNRERFATIAIGALLCALAVGSVVGASIRLNKKDEPDDAVAGIVIASVSISFMFFLWMAKVKASIMLDSRTLEADAACSFGCISLSFVLLFGSALYQGSTKLWWVDAVSTLLLACFIAWEGVNMIRAACKEDFDGCGCTHEEGWASKFLRKRLMTNGGKLKEAILKANQLTGDRTYTQSGGLLYDMACDQLCECSPCSETCCPQLYDASRIPSKTACAVPCGLGCCTHLQTAAAGANSGTTTAAAPGDLIGTDGISSSTITLAIEYMCGAKEAKFVEDTVGARAGVKTIAVSLAKKHAIIEYDAAVETQETLIDSIDEMGFEASVSPAPGGGYMEVAAVVSPAAGTSIAIAQPEAAMVVLEVD